MGPLENIDLSADRITARVSKTNVSLLLAPRYLQVSTFFVCLHVTVHTRMVYEWQYLVRARIGQGRGMYPRPRLCAYWWYSSAQSCCIKHPPNRYLYVAAKAKVTCTSISCIRALQIPRVKRCFTVGEMQDLRPCHSTWAANQNIQLAST